MKKSMTYAQSLIKPKMMGINMKQVTDYLVPWNVVVLFDDKKYHEIEAHIASEDFENKHLGALSLYGKEIYGLAIRNPINDCLFHKTYTMSLNNLLRMGII